MAKHIDKNTFRYAEHHEFEWTDLHLPAHETAPLRHEYDRLASIVVDKLQALARDPNRKPPAPVDPSSEKASPDSAPAAAARPGPPDLYALLRDHHHQDPDLAQLWTEVNAVPDWVDWEQLRRGQRFFYRYAMANLVGFALQGFVGENTAAASVVEVLVRTGGFSVRALRRRLMATFQLILEVTQSLDAVMPGGAGHATAVRVRLLHSAVRNRVVRLAEADPSYFDLAQHGPPINTLDSIHSVATFGCNHMWLQLPRMGVRPSDAEAADYIALWRYVGHVMGTPHEPFDSLERAKATMESMLVTESRITPTSDVVCHNFVEFLTDLPPFNISAAYIQAGSRHLNGHEFCDELGLGRPGWYARACFTGTCWLVAGLAALQQYVPFVDRLVTDWFRHQLHQAIIHSRSGLAGGSKFTFKYVPRAGQRTGKETASHHDGALSFWQRPTELLFFGVFAIVWLARAAGLLGLLGLLWVVIAQYYGFELEAPLRFLAIKWLPHT